MLLFAGCMANTYAQVKKPVLSPQTYLAIRKWQQEERKRAAGEVPDSLLKAPEKTGKQIYYLSATVKVADQQGWEVLEKAGCRIRSRRGNMATVSIPMDKMEELSQNEHIAAIEAARQLKIFMDTVRIVTQANEIQAGTGLGKPYTGEGVIVGIVDAGIDFTHPTFYDTEGQKNRILCAWNQWGKDLPAPEGYDYGSEYCSEEELVAAGTDLDEGTHGTHVLGIAAGSGYGSPYRGIAPASDLIVVGTTLDDANIIDGVNYILQKAEEAGKPCVINLSLGNLFGPHDGTSLICQWYNTFIKEGAYIVNAAGNAGNDNIYLEHSVAAPADSIIQTFLNYNYEGGACDFWTTEKDVKLQYLITDHNENIVAQSGYLFPSLKMEEPTVVFDTLEYNGELFPFMFSGGVNPYNHKINMTLTVENKECAIRPLVRIVHSTGTVRGWNGSGFMTSELGFTPIRKDYSVSDELASEVLGVGSWTSRVNWKDISHTPQEFEMEKDQMSFFSSVGPTLNKEIVPDVVAPGAVIVSAYSSFHTSPTTDQVLTTKFRGKNYPWGIDMGTSMAAPVVTGALALWRQANPELTFQEIKEIARQTAIPAWEMDYPNNTAGYGKINILGGLQEALRRTESIPENLADRTGLLKATLTQDGICLRWKEAPHACSVALFDLSGRKIYDARTTEKEHLIPSVLLKKDTYLLQVLSENGVFSQKIICP